MDFVCGMIRVWVFGIRYATHERELIELAFLNWLFILHGIIYIGVISNTIAINKRIQKTPLDDN